MPQRNCVLFTAGTAACLALCVGGVGCQTTSVGTDGYTHRVSRAAAPEALPAQGAVVAASFALQPPRPAARPTANAEEVSGWQPVQRVTAEKPAAPPRGVTRVSAQAPAEGATRAAIEAPVLQPIAVAGATAPPGEPIVPPPPHLEPQAVIVGPPPPAVLAPPVLPPHATAPREFAKQPLPPYVVEPPDILLVEATPELVKGFQPIAGQHLVRPDGTISLGTYGNVYVAGLTLNEARDAMAAQIHITLDLKPIDEIKKGLVVDVLAYNSKVYYVITDGGGYGEQVYPIPITGNETVLDALSKINGLPPVASKKRIWVARATPDCDHPEILKVDWCGITQRGCAATNYQIIPNDRVYVASDAWIRTESWLSKRLNPVDRLMGSILLGSSTVNSIRTNGRTGAGTGTGTGVTP
jgi:polysaccharide biosynthesis/export protein